MGMPAILKQTGVGRSSMWLPDFFQDPFNIGIGCVATGTVTYNIEHTFDDPNAALATFQGSITTTVLTVGVLYSGALAVGQAIFAPSGILPYTTISSLGTGSGGIGTYNLSNSQSVALGPMQSYAQTWFQNSGINGVVNANSNGNYQFPVRGITINVTSGAGSVTATLIQATFPR